jgi:hypothetical protein
VSYPKLTKGLLESRPNDAGCISKRGAVVAAAAGFSGQSISLKSELGIAIMRSFEMSQLTLEHLEIIAVLHGNQ